MIKLLAFLISLIMGVGFVTSVMAQGPQPSCQPTDLGCIPTDDPVEFTSRVYGIGLGFIGGVALLFIILGGYQILSSQGDPEKLRKGKNMIFYAVIGIVLAVLGFGFYQIIGADILRIPGFG